ncbi:MAG TPA: HAD family phosphatase [Nocardioidaceae bacterium]|nr:HAD family phosphatase [Nocardioidaceae bacterium]
MSDVRLAGVLLDLDGTLCDTETDWIAAEGDIAREYDVEWTHDDALHIVGFDLYDAAAYVRERMGLLLSLDETVGLMLDRAIARVRARGVDWRPGAIDLVAACNDAGVPVAIVTSSHKPFVAAILEAMPRGRFDAVVSGDDVPNGKPAPDPYLMGAAALGVDPAACVAIEDSPTGSQSAYAAGCVVVVVPNHVIVPLEPGMREIRTLSGVNPQKLAVFLSER